jgi:hypothetical protein
MAKLYVLSGPELGKSVAVQAGDSVGRTAETPITLKHASISRRHAHFECENGAWSVVDDGSTNGITSQGARTKRLALTDGCEFKLGEIELRFRADVHEAASEVRPSVAVPPQAPRSAPGAAADDDEIRLEGDDEPASAAPPRPTPRFEAAPQRSEPRVEVRVEVRAPAPVPSPAPVRTAPIDTGFGPAPAGAGATINRNKERSGERILQYSKVEGRGGLANADLAQVGGFTKFLIVVAALAFAAGLAWFAFSGASWFKSRVGGGDSEAPAESSDE